METHRQRQPAVETAQDAETPSDVALALAQAESAGHPMGTVGAWVRDFSLFGLTAGLVFGGALSATLPDLEGAAAMVAVVIMTSILMGVQGCLAGLASGTLLRGLRGRVPAAVGLAVAVVGAWFATSLIPMAWGNFPSLDGTLRGLPLTLAVTALIPFTAVLRSRGRNTLGWILGTGVGVGALLAPWAWLVKSLI